MFFLDTKKEVRVIKIRDEWGVLHEVTIRRDASYLTDKELAEALGTSRITVETHRRD